MISPLLTQLTYEGLVDELVGLKNCSYISAFHSFYANAIIQHTSNFPSLSSPHHPQPTSQMPLQHLMPLHPRQQLQPRR